MNDQIAEHTTDLEDKNQQITGLTNQNRALTAEIENLRAQIALLSARENVTLGNGDPLLPPPPELSISNISLNASNSSNTQLPPPPANLFDNNNQ